MSVLLDFTGVFGLDQTGLPGWSRASGGAGPAGGGRAGPRAACGSVVRIVLEILSNRLIGSPPFWYIPETSLTVHSGHMVYTLA